MNIVMDIASMQIGDSFLLFSYFFLIWNREHRDTVRDPTNYTQDELYVNIHVFNL